MTAGRTIVDVLAKLPEPELRRMRERAIRERDRLRSEVTRLQIEHQMFEEAAEIRAGPTLDIRQPGRAAE